MVHASEAGRSTNATGGPDLPGEATPNIEVESAAMDQSYVFENLIQLYIYDTFI
jgi:hypothetical protein